MDSGRGEFCPVPDLGNHNGKINGGVRSAQKSAGKGGQPDLEHEAKEESKIQRCKTLFEAKKQNPKDSEEEICCDKNV